MAFGASPEDRKAFNELMKDPDNKKCADCGTPNPQWANVHHGVFICLHCAGTHRGLGVHLSFVRSITMDKWLDWKPEKLKQMQLGGNAKANNYFAANGVPKGNNTGDPADQQAIKARYNHINAFKYRAMLEHLAEGKPWSPDNFVPPPEYNPDWDKAPAPARRGPGGGGGRISGSGLGSSPPPSSGGGAEQKLNEAGKAVSEGLNKLGNLGWMAGSAIAEAGKKAGTQAKEQASKIEMSNVQKSAEEGWQKAGNAASAGWGWLSRTVTNAASQIQSAASGEGSDDAFAGLKGGPVGEGDTYLVGEMVVWQGATGSPQRATISAVDDRSTPPTYILKLDDGGKRGAPHSQLRKWGKQFDHKEGHRSQNSSPVQPPPQQSRASTSSSPTAKSPIVTKKPAPAKKDDDDDDDWGADEDWTPGAKKDD